MTIQDQSDTPDSSTLLPGGNKISLDSAAQTITSEGHVPKLRKPYTITKQRERWAEEEHKKFLEALKLYGRAWRKIEDHVGTKTAVQIRSHAQKFFSKVVRESNDSNTSSIRATEIPPPRPKRKPMHPYPRKLVIPVKKDAPRQEQSAISASPNSSFDQEHQSPTSVLCVFPSETLGFEDDPGTPDGSSSPMSSQLEEQKPVSVKLELSPKLDAFTKEGSLEATSPKTLKLFGKTMLLDDPEKSATSSISLDQQQVATKFIDFMPFPFFPLDNMNSMKVEDDDKETCKSWSSFTAGAVIASGNCQMSENTETQFHEYSLELTRIQQSLAHVSQPKHSGSLKRSSSEKYTRGFVPYKRSLSEKGTQSSTIAGALNNELQRTRLCF